MTQQEPVPEEICHDLENDELTALDPLEDEPETSDL